MHTVSIICVASIAYVCIVEQFSFVSHARSHSVEQGKHCIGIYIYFCAYAEQRYRYSYCATFPRPIAQYIVKLVQR